MQRVDFVSSQHACFAQPRYGIHNTCY